MNDIFLKLYKLSKEVRARTLRFNGQIRVEVFYFVLFLEPQQVFVLEGFACKFLVLGFDDAEITVDNDVSQDLFIVLILVVAIGWLSEVS